MKRKSAAESAFFSPRFVVGFVLCLIGTILALLVFGLLSGGSASAQGPNQNQASSDIEVGASYRNDVSPPMRDVPPWAAAGLKPQHEANENPKVPYPIRTALTPSSRRRPSPSAIWWRPVCQARSLTLTAFLFPAWDATAHRPIPTEQLEKPNTSKS